MEKYASETGSFYAGPEAAKANRKLFVHNLGELLKQTREEVVECELDDSELVHVKFEGGYELKVNVNMDSYMCIVSDVVKAIKL